METSGHSTQRTQPPVRHSGLVIHSSFVIRHSSLFLLLAMISLATPWGQSAEPAVKNIVFLGDSLSAGYGLEPEEAFPSLIADKIESEGLPFRVSNAGVSGDTTAGGLRRLNWVLKRRADVLIIELGGNDGLRGIPVSETRKNLRRIIDRARQSNPSIQIILAGMQMPQNMGPDYTKEFRKMFSEIAMEKKVVLIPFLLEGVGGVQELNQPDLIHPNVTGHQRVAENVWKYLKPLLVSE